MGARLRQNFQDWWTPSMQASMTVAHNSPETADQIPRMTSIRLTALFGDYPGEPVPER